MLTAWLSTIAMLLQKAQKSLETLINKGFSNIENVRKMAFYNKITTIQQNHTNKYRLKSPAAKRRTARLFELFFPMI